MAAATCRACGERGVPLALHNLPAEVYEKEWDMVMIDAPKGYFASAPGRMAAVWTAAAMARGRRGEGDTDVFSTTSTAAWRRPTPRSSSARGSASAPPAASGISGSAGVAPRNGTAAAGGAGAGDGRDPSAKEVRIAIFGGAFLQNGLD